MRTCPRVNGTEEINETLSIQPTSAQQIENSPTTPVQTSTPYEIVEILTQSPKSTSSTSSRPASTASSNGLKHKNIRPNQSTNPQIQKSNESTFKATKQKNTMTTEIINDLKSNGHNPAKQNGQN